MGIDFAPQRPHLAAWQEEISHLQDDFDLFASSEAEEESLLPSGWWILPFAAAGLIECYFAMDWIFAKL